MRGRRVLVIDDNADNRGLMGSLLTSFGHEAVLADGGAVGVKVAMSERPDIVLLDLHMPEMDGYETAQRIRAEPCLDGMPIAAVTADDQEATLARGFDGCISKPIDPESFVGQVEAILTGPPDGGERGWAWR